MISRRRPGATAGARLLLLTVLLGLFAMHVLTAHGVDHHGNAAAGSAAHSGTGRSATGHDVTTRDSASMAMVDHDPVGPAEPAAPAAGPAVPAVLVGTAATASAGAQGGGAGLTLCWLLLTAGVVLLALLLRSVRRLRRRLPAADAPTATGPSRPRAPPGRARLHELTVLRV